MRNSCSIRFLRSAGAAAIAQHGSTRLLMAHAVSLRVQIGFDRHRGHVKGNQLYTATR